MSSLTQKEKLRALGVKAPTVQNNPYLSTFDAIREEKDYSTFTSDVNGQASFAEFETYLTDTIGVGSETASRFRQRMEQKYETFGDFGTALSGFSSYDEWINSFSWGTTIAGDETDGEQISAGIRIHGEDGLSYDGVGVPKGTLEVFGPRVELSQTPPPIDASSSFSTANLQVSETLPSPYETITISADITNDSGYGLDHTAKLTEDGQVVKSKTVSFAAGETKTVEFTRRYTDYVSVDVKVNEAGPTTVTVIPQGLQVF
jgi:hypothetical protein